MNLWLPDGTQHIPRVGLPEGDTVTLRDGRVLKQIDRFNHGHMTGQRWLCTRDGLRIICTIDDTPKHGKLLHVSISYKNRDPDWDTIKQVRDAFFTDKVDAMMVLPRPEDYVNHQKHTFHLFQTPTAWGLG